MIKSRQSGDAEVDEVQVHVTYFGGFYVNPGELLRSKAAQETMANMARALGDEGSASRVDESSAHGPNEPPPKR